jgi:hypothetical protein
MLDTLVLDAPGDGSPASPVSDVQLQGLRSSDAHPVVTDEVAHHVPRRGLAHLEAPAKRA